MPPRAPVILTAKGNPLTRNPARVVFAADCLRRMTYSAARTEICKQWRIHKATAEKDIRAAKQLIALELDAIEVRAGEVRRNERIADRAEELAEEATVRAKAGDSAANWSAVAALQRTAVAASREVSRLTGAYAPKEVKVTHSGSIDVALRIDAVLLVLDERDLADLDRITAKIAAAQAAGQLAEPEPEPEPEPEEVLDAEIVEPGPGEN